MIFSIAFVMGPLMFFSVDHQIPQSYLKYFSPVLRKNCWGNQMLVCLISVEIILAVQQELFRIANNC